MVPFNHSLDSHIQLFGAGAVCSGLKGMATFRFYELSSEMLRSGIRMLFMGALSFREAALEQEALPHRINMSNVSFFP